MANIVSKTGQIPFFMSGPRLVIRADGRVLAFAVGLDITVSRNVQTVYQFGQVSPVANQVTLYNGVTGSMQIIKLADVDARASKEAALPANTNGNGSVAASGNIAVPDINGAEGNHFIPKQNIESSVLNYTSNLQKQLDPELVLLSSTFDIEVYQTYPNPDQDNKYLVKKHFTIKNVRLNSRGTTIAPGSLTSESVGFVGTLFVSEGRDGPDDLPSDQRIDRADNGASEG